MKATLRACTWNSQITTGGKTRQRARKQEHGVNRNWWQDKAKSKYRMVLLDKVRAWDWDSQLMADHIIDNKMI